MDIRHFFYQSTSKEHGSIVPLYILYRPLLYTTQHFNLYMFWGGFGVSTFTYLAGALRVHHHRYLHLSEVAVDWLKEDPKKMRRGSPRS
jgi:hypothetical protein